MKASGCAIACCGEEGIEDPYYITAKFSIRRPNVVDNDGAWCSQRFVTGHVAFFGDTKKASFHGRILKWFTNNTILYYLIRETYFLWYRKKHNNWGISPSFILYRWQISAPNRTFRPVNTEIQAGTQADLFTPIYTAPKVQSPQASNHLVAPVKFAYSCVAKIRKWT